MEEGVVKSNSQVSGLGDWVVPLITIGKINRGSRRESLKEIVNCLSVDMLNLRYLWAIQWKD